MRLATVAALAIAALGAREAAPALIVAAPATWAYRVNDACQWQPRAWAAALNADATPLREESPAMWSCQARRGLKSPTPFLKHIAARWPSQAELTAWETPHENDRPFRAPR